MKTLGIIANCTKPRAATVLKKLEARAAELGLKLLADPATERLLPSCAPAGKGNLFEQVDAVIALGGDGTMLRVVRALEGRDKPVMGINIGALGFMTSVAEGQVDEALKCLASDDFKVSVRALLDIVVEREGRAISRFRALNEAVISSGPPSRMITLKVSINSEDVNSYACDGLMVSTPTGSTGHSLSAGGPILVPDARVVVLSVICPHTLSSRPLVAPDSVEIAIAAVECAGAMILSIDGQVQESLLLGDCVKIRRSDRNVRFIHLPGHSYFSVLRQKLHWSGSSV